MSDDMNPKTWPVAPWATASVCQCTACLARAGDRLGDALRARTAGMDGPEAVRGFDRLQVSLVAPTHLPGVAPEPPATAMLRPGDESPPRPCCRRIGAGWCARPDDGHSPEQCAAPPPRALPAVDFGPRAATTTGRGQP